NPAHVPIHYTVQVFDGLRPQFGGGAGLVFEPNRGQANDSVSYLALGSTYAIGLAADHAALVLRGDGASAGASAFMEWVGGNDSPTAMPLDPLPGVSNYLLGESSIAGVPHYARVRYASVYDGIDLEYYGREGVLEYDWIVRPGADVSAIAMRFHGVDEIVTDSVGNLRLQMRDGELVERAPVAYQLIDGQRRDVTSRFVLQADGKVTFAVGDYDHSAPLIIDPVLVYSTFFGGASTYFGDNPSAVAVDSQGNTYITGRTASPDFPTVNPFDDDLNEPETTQFYYTFDAFVSKFDPQGVPVFSTYLGGGSNAYDTFGTRGYAVAVDPAGHVFVGGDTDSPIFPKRNPAPAPFASASPSLIGSFLTELSADGSAILYSTVFAGLIAGQTSQILDLAINANGEVYATGLYLTFKLDPTSNTIGYVYSQGGIGRGIAVDDFGQAYVAGFTYSSSFPTKNALFPELHNRQIDERNNIADAFVVKLSAAGDVLFSTYLGGRGSDSAADIALDENGVIYVVGSTNSDDLPTPGGLDTSINGGTDGFLIKLANDGQSLVYGTYIGGGGEDQVTGVGVDA
ncbi:MAG: SBBP repeat-containing protein, partial [Hyphomicrobiales bacterium]